MKIFIPVLGSIAILLGWHYFVQVPIQPTQQETQLLPMLKAQIAKFEQINIEQLGKTSQSIPIQRFRYYLERMAENIIFKLFTASG